MSCCRFSPKKWTNEFVLFAFLLFTANKTNSFVRFLGKSTARPNCFWFYLTLNCISFSIIVPAYIADSEELPTPMAQTGDSNFFYGAGIQLFVAAAGFIITVLATVYCFCLRKEARLTLEQRDQIQKEKWEKRTNAQRYWKMKRKNIVMPNPSACPNFFNYLCIQNYLKPF